MEDKILEVANLTTTFSLIKNTVTAVENLSFHLNRNEILAVVGESGSGKSVTNYSIMNLIEPPGKISEKSEIFFNGKNILKMDDKEVSEIRGNRISMIFQEPSASFNQLFRIGPQIGENLRIHNKTDKKNALKEAENLLKKVHITNAESRVMDYPFQMSGGMLQRAMIAQALACSPDILLADEPTTALDVTTQAQILSLIYEKKEETGMSVIFVTHDLALVEHFADRIIILYNGRIMETGYTEDIFKNPSHPYTKDLLKAVPVPGIFKDTDRLFTIKGKVPSADENIPGCRYSPRCSSCFERCLKEEPELLKNGDKLVRCHLAE